MWGFPSLDVILDEGASRLGFRALAAALEEFEGDERSAASAYLAERLDAWPDRTRCAPWSWFMALCQGRPPLPAWPLVRSLDLTHPVDRSWCPDSLPTDAGVLSGLVELTLSRPGAIWELVLDHPRAFAGLRTLCVGGGHDEEDSRFRPLSSSPLVRQLEAVQLGDTVTSSYQLGQPNMFRLLDDGAARHRAECLRSLGFRTPNVADMCRGLANYPLPALRELRVSFGLGDNRSGRPALPTPSAARALLGRVENVRLEGVDAVAFEQLSAVTELRPRSARITRVNPGREPAAAWARMLGLPEERGIQQVLALHPERIEADNGAVTALRLDLGDGRPRPRKVLHGADLSTVRTLHLTGYAGATSAMVDLLDVTRLRQLRTLRIAPGTGGGYHYTGEPVLQALLASGLLGQLESLTLRSPDRPPDRAGTRGSPLADQTVESLARADLRRLTHLDLTGCYIGDRGAAALSRAMVPRLTSLDLSLNGITADGLAALLSGTFPSLRTLDMGFNEIGAGAPAVQPLPPGLLDGAPRLRGLSLARNHAKAGFAGSDLARRLLSQLWALNLSGNDQDDATLQAMADNASTSLVHVEYWTDKHDANDEIDESTSGLFSDDTARTVARSATFARLDQFVTGAYDIEDDYGHYDVSLASPTFTARGHTIISRSNLRSPAIASLEEAPMMRETADP